MKLEEGSFVIGCKEMMTMTILMLLSFLPIYCKEKGFESNLLEEIIMLLMMMLIHNNDGESSSSRSSRLKSDCSAASLM